MSLEARVIALAQQIGADVKALRTSTGDLTTLKTTAKGNLVAALNELFGMVGNTGAKIDDTAGDGVTTVTWSADKIGDQIVASINSLRTELTNGAAAALDTFGELAKALGNDPNYAATIATALGNRVRFDAAQALTAAQKALACANIGVGDPERDFVADYTTARG